MMEGNVGMAQESRFNSSFPYTERELCEVPAALEED